MEDTDRLDVGGVAIRRRWWVAAVLVTAVLAGLAIVGVTRSDRSSVRPPTVPSATSPTPPAPTSPSAAWPTGMGAGSLYVLDDDGLVRINLADGQSQRPDLDVSDVEDTMSAARGGVLVAPYSGRTAPRLVVDGRPYGGEIGATLRAGRQFLPGPNGAVWTSKGEPESTAGAAWQLVDRHGAITGTARVSGFVISDGADGLFDVLEDRVHHIEADGRESRWAGEVLATGPDGYATRRCRGSRCTTVLHDRTRGQETALSAAVAAAISAGHPLAALSPGNRFVATSAAAEEVDDGPTAIQVSDPVSGRVVRSIAGSDERLALAWISPRWLVATRADGLTLYDAVEDVLVAAGPELRDPDEIVVQLSP